MSATMKNSKTNTWPAKAYENITTQTIRILLVKDTTFALRA